MRNKANKLLTFSMGLSRQKIETLLDRHPVAVLATLGQDQLIHQVPIVFARYHGAIWSPIDGKPKSGGQLARITNIQNNPQVSLLLEHYHKDWSGLWWIRIEATAKVVHPDLGNDPQLQGVLKALLAKYPQYRETTVLREPATLLKIKPERIVSWCAGAMQEKSAEE